MGKYQGTVLKEDISIDRIFTIHYFEYPKGFAFSGESHDFWELVYIDKGSALVTANDRQFTLPHGNITFHKPGEWHNIKSETASNSVIISFECHSEKMNFFEDKILKVGNAQKEIISKIIKERIHSFEKPLGDPYSYKLVRKASSPVGSEQLIKQYLAELLILLIRDDENPLIFSSFKNRINEKIFLEAEAFMLNNINKSLSLKEIASFSNVSISALREIFHSNTSGGVMEYFISLKIEQAKKYIRDGDYNLTQIAEFLGYSGLHYFSRQFKQKTGMSPSQYSKSIKSTMKGEL